MTSWHGPMTRGALDLAMHAAQANDRGLASSGEKARTRLERPLTVAIVGRQSAGKSTLLNALLETPIAPTAGGECTKVLYFFRNARWTSATLHSRKNGTFPIPLEDSRLPSEFSFPARDIDHVEVLLNVPFLKNYTLIDTPGLASTNEETSAVTHRLLADTRNGAANADALIYCVNGPLKDDEGAAVRQFRDDEVERLNRGTTVAVLTKSDQLGGELRRLWKSATELASTMSTQHGDLFYGVHPVIGLLAQTAAVGALADRHARALGVLAREWDPDRAYTWLLSPDLFRRAKTDVPVALRGELMDLIGLFGIMEMLDAIRSGVRADSPTLTTIARKISGLDEVKKRLHDALAARTDVLKAGAALQMLQAAAHRARDSAVYDRAEALLDQPAMFPLQLLKLSKALVSGDVRPPQGLIEQAWIAVQSGLRPGSASEASREAAQWRMWARTTDVRGQRFAQIMIRAWQLAARERDDHAQ